MLGLSAGQEKKYAIPHTRSPLKIFHGVQCYIPYAGTSFSGRRKKCVFQNQCQNSHYQKSQKE